MIRHEDLEFRELNSADEQQALDAHQEMLEEDFQFLFWTSNGESWEDYTCRMSSWRRGEHLPDGWVRTGFFVAVEHGYILGRVSVRYELNESLEHVGGHIGYGVLPDSRRRGVASALCRYGLQELAAAGVAKALITCHADNEGSKATILGCGGVLDPRLPSVRNAEGVEELRFWVPTS
ncbi:GNAT family N-acetyltransferase [Glutamicibacter sp.]|uniref:GNAT family N-acetyltransferase n=1 Tax=Glutamicibacter sp. TaxID=1931995 RepID=UPI0028BE9D2B|nr:GNAT family N-acetyltransferase [Glutamicibacter sp.]